MATHEITPAAPPLGADRLLAVILAQADVAGSGLDLGHVGRIACERAQGLVRADGAVVELLRDGRLVSIAGSGSAAGELGYGLELDGSLSGRCLRERRVLRCDDTERDPRVDAHAARSIGAASMICVPLEHAGAPVGVLKVAAARPGGFGAEDEGVLAHLARPVGAHLAHAATYERASFESLHDPVTGLQNRRAYELRLAKEVARAQRYGHRLALLLIDLDGFKEVNDRLGHPAGDEVLRRVAGALRRVRLTDECFRIGGDEFALVMPDTGRAGGEHVAERITRLVAEATGGPAVTATAGLATFVGQSAAQLHREADEALLRGKRRR